MFRDPRGGHNRKLVNENFFKTWSPNMAYVLGLILADGAVEDVRKSSRTCYFQITNTDNVLLNKVRKILSSNHKFQVRQPQLIDFKGKKYMCSKVFYLRIGNKAMFQDLVNLGVTPRKSLRLNLPNVPEELLRFLVRGYFDGDGCVNIYQPKNRKRPWTNVIFTSGCRQFLEKLKQKLEILPKAHASKIYFNHRAYRLGYRNRQALAVLNFIYEELNLAPYMIRKHKIYQQALST